MPRSAPDTLAIKSVARWRMAPGFTAKTYPMPKGDPSDFLVGGTPRTSWDCGNFWCNVAVTAEMLAGVLILTSAGAPPVAVNRLSLGGTADAELAKPFA